MKGFFNRLLHIDLTRKSCSYESIPDALLEKYLGGKGLGTYLWYHRNAVGVDPFSPENLFIIDLCTATGTRI